MDAQNTVTYMVQGFGTYAPGKFTVGIRQDRGLWHWTRRETYNPGSGTWVSRECWSSRVQAESAAFRVARCYDAIVVLPEN